MCIILGADGGGVSNLVLREKSLGESALKCVTEIDFCCACVTLSIFAYQLAVVAV